HRPQGPFRLRQPGACGGDCRERQLEIGEMMLTSVSDPPVQASRLAQPRIVREDLPDGSFVLRSTASLQPYERCIGEWLERWAREAPDNVFLAEREQGDGARSWRTVTYAQAREAVR